MGNFLTGVVGPLMLYLGFFIFAAALVVGGLDAYYFARAVPVEATVQDREVPCTLKYTARDQNGDDRIYESARATCEQAELHALLNPQHEYRFVRHHRTLFIYVMPDGATHRIWTSNRMFTRDRIKVGDTFTIMADPEEPEKIRAVHERRNIYFMLVFAVLAGIAMYAGRSLMRRRPPRAAAAPPTQTIVTPHGLKIERPVRR